MMAATIIIIAVHISINSFQQYNMLEALSLYIEKCMTARSANTVLWQKPSTGFIQQYLWNGCS